MNPVVSFKNVTKSYGHDEVLKKISFDVQEGDVVALIGQSGSGKSTALRCINGLEKINGGELQVCGRNLHDENCDIFGLRKEVGIVFQSYNLFPHLSVEQNITIAPRKVKKIKAREAHELAMHVLNQVGLAEKAGAYPEQLSGGQQQRVAIARSLAMQPKLMLFDEVTSALDPQITGEVLKVIASLANEGMTMVLVTHEMAFAQAVADQILYIHDGLVWESGDASLLKNPKTAELKAFISNGL